MRNPASKPQRTATTSRTYSDQFCPGARSLEPTSVPSRFEFKSVALLVEQRVRKSLARVKTGETTPQECLQSVVEQLAKELNDHQFSLLIKYFQNKKGPLSGAKQLLLESLCTARQGTPARSCRTAAHTQQQKFGSSTHSATTAVQPSCWHTPPPQLPLEQQQQQQHPAGRKAAAAAGSDTAPCSDQGYPLSFTELLLQQQQQQQQQQRKHPPQAHTDSTAPAAAAGSSKWRAFAVSQGLGPLQL